MYPHVFHLVITQPVGTSVPVARLAVAHNKASARQRWMGTKREGRGADVTCDLAFREGHRNHIPGFCMTLIVYQLWLCLVNMRAMVSNCQGYRNIM